MPILSDRDIKKNLEDREIDISPFSQKNLQPSSYDLSLSNNFLEFIPGRVINTSSPPEMTEYILNNGSVRIEGHSFLLGTTEECITLGNRFCARVDGRSSIGRLGIVVHATAGFIDPGFSGRITLEFFNFNNLPVEIEIGKRVCQIVFEELSSPAERPYGSEELKSKYMLQKRVTESRGYLDE